MGAERGSAMSYEEIARYRAVILVPHVPNSCSFADVYAMRIPIFIPAEPCIYRWMWTFSDPFAGPGGDRRKRLRILDKELMPQPPAAWLAAGGAKEHPYDVFAHYILKMSMDHLTDQVYWFQYSEYSFLPGLQRFRSVAELVIMLLDFSSEQATEASRLMGKAHARRVSEVSAWLA